MESFSAKSYRDLTTSLARIDLSVPARGDREDKRTTAHVERWSICKFLATYGHTRFVRYPQSRIACSSRERTFAAKQMSRSPLAPERAASKPGLKARPPSPIICKNIAFLYTFAYDWEWLRLTNI